MLNFIREMQKVAARSLLYGYILVYLGAFLSKL